MLNRDLIKTMERLRKEQINVLKQYLEEFIEESKKEIEANEKRSGELDTQIRNLLEEKKYLQINSLTEEISLINAKFESKKAKSEKASALLNEINKYVSNLSKYDEIEMARILSSLEKEIVALDRKVPARKVKLSVDKKGSKKVRKIKNVRVKTSNNNQESNPAPKNETVIANPIEPIETTVGNPEELEVIKEATKAVEKAEQTKLEKDIKSAIELVSKLEDSKDAEELKQRLIALHNKIEEEKVIEATKAVEKAEKTKSEEDKNDALVLVERLEEGKIKEQLKERLSKIKDKVLEDFKTLLRKMENQIADNNYISSEKLQDSVNLYQELSKENKEAYKERLNNVIKNYNIDCQDKLKNNMSETGNIPKVSLKDRIYEFFGAPYKWFAKSLVGRWFFAKLRKTLKKMNKKELAEGVKNSIRDLDIASGVRLNANKNKLAKIKTKLYRDGYCSLSKTQAKKYDSARNYISDKINKKVNKLAQNDRIFEDKVRVINLADQYLQSISLGDGYEEVSEDAIEFMTNAYNYKVFSEAEYKGYLSEIERIISYRNYQDGEIYEFSSDLLDDSIKYYDESDLDLEYANGISYEKRK